MPELTCGIWLPATRGEVFDFFSRAENLERITPPWLSFRILTPLPIEMREGALIDYRIRLRVLPMRWRTRISSWLPDQRFVDEQIKGPYTKWVHLHEFESRDGGTWCTDRVSFESIGGAMVVNTLVKPDLLRIFSYRQQAMREIFRAAPDTPAQPVQIA